MHATHANPYMPSTKTSAGLEPIQTHILKFTLPAEAWLRGHLGPSHTFRSCTE